MINLTTSCGKSDTLLAACWLIFFVAPAISLGQLEENPRPTDFGISVLQQNGNSTAENAGVVQQPQDDPFVIQEAIAPSDDTPSSEIQQAQQDAPSLPGDAVDLEQPQVLLRGPLHEAFAEPHQADPQPNAIVNAAPPEAIQEVPPEFKPEGNNVEWIPGYWAWDVSQNDFIWISGVWRDIPPNQRWVPGYWEQAEQGHRWIAGFWTSLETEELSYLPTPPANLDRGPSVVAPSDDYFYCPGNWEFQNGNFVWRTGHWQPRVANWIWIPARYIWTPNGCIYRPGYWDREFDVRGTLFAPVHFQQQQHLVTGFRFQPNHCVNTGAEFFVHLFVQPNCNHYVFGDWYGQNFGNTGFRPWVQPQSHFRNYDPLLAHYNCSRFRHGSQLLIDWVQNQHRHYHRNLNLRPRNTLQAQVNFANASRGLGHYDFIERARLANRYDDIARGRGNRNHVQPISNRDQRNDNPNFKRNYVRTNHLDRDLHNLNERLRRELSKSRKLNEQRSRNSGRNDLRRAQDKPSRKPENHTKNTSGLTRAQIEKARRDREKAIRKREVEQKIAAVKQQAEIKRKQREVARLQTERERQQKLEQTRQRLAAEKQARQAKRNQDASRSKNQKVQSRGSSSTPKNTQATLDRQRRQQQAQNRRDQSSQNTQRQSARQKAEIAKQQREIAKRQRDAQNRMAAERAKQSAQQKAAQTREAARKRDLQRQRDKAARTQAAAKKRSEIQAKIARDKLRRESERRAAQQRVQQKAQADAQRRASEKSQREAQRKAAEQARRAADLARKKQRDQEKAARRAKRKKK